MFSPTVSAPLTFSSGAASRDELAELGDQRLGALVEPGAVLLGPPVAQAPSPS